jgi:hypothetical protein
MELKDLVALYFERTNAMQALWSIYVTIVLGLLGFLGTVKLKQPRLRIITLLLFAFCGFAYVNCDALRSVTRQRHVAADLIRSSQQTDAQKQISNSLDPPPIAGVVAFHLAGDIITVFAILALGLRGDGVQHGDHKPTR